jgi:hypothetical protein
LKPVTDVQGSTSIMLLSVRHEAKVASVSTSDASD